MMDFSARAARNLILIKRVRELRKEMEQAGIDNLKLLADNGVSIVATYLNGCSPQRKKEIKRDFGEALSMGITGDMILNELARQMPEIGRIMVGKDGYRKAELAKMEAFLKER